MPFDHGVGTPVSSPQSRLSTPFDCVWSRRRSALRLFDAPSRLSDALRHRCRRTDSAIRRPSSVPVMSLVCSYFGVHVFCYLLLWATCFRCRGSHRRFSSGGWLAVLEGILVLVVPRDVGLTRGFGWFICRPPPSLVFSLLFLVISFSVFYCLLFPCIPFNLSICCKNMACKALSSGI